MKVSELMELLQDMPPDAEVMRRGDLDVMQPLELEGLITVQRAYYEGLEDRPPHMRAWFDEGVLGYSLRKVERYETQEAVILRREGDRR